MDLSVTDAHPDRTADERAIIDQVAESHGEEWDEIVAEVIEEDRELLDRSPTSRSFRRSPERTPHRRPSRRLSKVDPGGFDPDPCAPATKLSASMRLGCKTVRPGPLFSRDPIAAETSWKNHLLARAAATHRPTSSTLTAADPSRPSEHPPRRTPPHGSALALSFAFLATALNPTLLLDVLDELADVIRAGVRCGELIAQRVALAFDLR